MKYLSEQIDIPVTTGNVTTAAIDASQLYRLSYQVDVQAGTTMTGSVQLEVSNQPVGTSYAMLPAPTKFKALGSPVALAAVNTQQLSALQEMSYRSFRLVFTGAGGNDAPVSIYIFAIAV